MICKKSAIHNPSIDTEIANFVNGEASILITKLREHWQKNNNQPALVFTWTTTLTERISVTYISTRAVAPFYRRCGLMKSLSLKLVEKLKDSYGEAHLLMATVIHNATYLFFNPHDKSFSQYGEGSLEEVSCGELMKKHQNLKKVRSDLVMKSIFPPTDKVRRQDPSRTQDLETVPSTASTVTINE